MSSICTCCSSYVQTEITPKERKNAKESIWAALTHSNIESLSSEEMNLYISTFLSLLLKAFLESFVRKESPHAFRSLFQCILWHLEREEEQLAKTIAWKNSKGLWIAIVFRNARKYVVIMIKYIMWCFKFICSF